MSTRSAFVRALLVVLAISFSLVATDADARRRRRRRSKKKRVVMLPFKGSKASTVRSRVIRKIKKRVRFVSYKKYRRAASRLKVDPRDPDGMVAICAELRCQAVVAGRVKRRGSRYTATVTVYDASSGDVIGRSKRRARGRRRLKRAGASLGSRVLKLVRKGSAPPRAPPPEEQAYEPPPPAEPPPPEEQPEEVPPLLSSEDTERVMDKLDEDEDEGASMRGIFDVYGGIGLSSRKFTLTGADPTQDREYDGGMYPEFIVGGEIYPFAFFMDNFAKNIGLSVNYARHIAVSTDLPDNPNRPADCNFEETVDTSSQQLLLDLKLRWTLPFGWKPVVMGVFGWGFREFGLGANDVLPSLNWQFLRFGASGRLPFGTPLIAFEGGFDMRMLLKAGQEAVDALGERSGGIGWSAHAGLRGDFSFGLFYFATFEYQAYSADFKGLANEEMVRDCFPDRTDATSGSDGYLRFWAGAGYAM